MIDNAVQVKKDSSWNKIVSIDEAITLLSSLSRIYKGYAQKTI